MSEYDLPHEWPDDEEERVDPGEEALEQGIDKQARLLEIVREQWELFIAAVHDVVVEDTLRESVDDPEDLEEMCLFIDDHPPLKEPIQKIAQAIVHCMQAHRPDALSAMRIWFLVQDVVRGAERTMQTDEQLGDEYLFALDDGDEFLQGIQFNALLEAGNRLIDVSIMDELQNAYHQRREMFFRVNGGPDTAHLPSRHN
jgi:hypothetical protein